MSTQTKEQIFSSDAFVLSEVHKLRTLYILKKEIRYDLQRNQDCDTESVAEHVYAMHCLIDYFLPLENPEGTWDALKIHKMAQYHDIDEIETGDIANIYKTAADFAKEKEACMQVIRRLPKSMQTAVESIVAEYTDQLSPEAKFVKAIDRVESLIQMYDEAGKQWQQERQVNHKSIDTFIKNWVESFPVIQRFTTIMTDRYDKEGFFYQES